MMRRLLWIIWMALSAPVQLAIAAVLGTAYLIGERWRVTHWRHCQWVELEMENQRLRHQLVSASAAAQGWEDMYRELSDVAHED